MPPLTAILVPRGEAGISASTPEGGVYQNRGPHNYFVRGIPVTLGSTLFFSLILILAGFHGASAETRGTARNEFDYDG